MTLILPMCKRHPDAAMFAAAEADQRIGCRPVLLARRREPLGIEHIGIAKHPCLAMRYRRRYHDEIAGGNDGAIDRERPQRLRINMTSGG